MTRSQIMELQNRNRRTWPALSTIATMVVILGSTGCVRWHHHLREHCLPGPERHETDYRQCSHCGKIIPGEGFHCPHCKHVPVFHGYEPTCWRNFPQGWGCAPEHAGSQELHQEGLLESEMIHESEMHEAPAPTNVAPLPPAERDIKSSGDLDAADAKLPVFDAPINEATSADANQIPESFELDNFTVRAETTNVDPTPIDVPSPKQTAVAESKVDSSVPVAKTTPVPDETMATAQDSQQKSPDAVDVATEGDAQPTTKLAEKDLPARKEAKIAVEATSEPIIAQLPPTAADTKPEPKHESTDSPQHQVAARTKQDVPEPASKAVEPTPASKVAVPTPASKVAVPTPASKVVESAPAKKIAEPTRAVEVADSAVAGKVTTTPAHSVVKPAPAMVTPQRAEPTIATASPKPLPVEVDAQTPIEQLGESQELVESTVAKTIPIKQIKEPTAVKVPADSSSGTTAARVTLAPPPTVAQTTPASAEPTPAPPVKVAPIRAASTPASQPTPAPAVKKPQASSARAPTPTSADEPVFEVVKRIPLPVASQLKPLDAGTNNRTGETNGAYTKPNSAPRQKQSVHTTPQLTPSPAQQSPPVRQRRVARRAPAPLNAFIARAPVVRQLTTDAAPAATNNLPPATSRGLQPRDEFGMIPIRKVRLSLEEDRESKIYSFSDQAPQPVNRITPAATPESLPQPPVETVIKRDQADEYYPTPVRRIQLTGLTVPK